MDSMDICTATSTADNKRRVNQKNRDQRKGLHLRKTVVQPPAMQSEDKHGPKKTADELEQNTAWPSSKPPHEAQQSQHRTNDSRNTLRFRCSQCTDGLEFVPKDLVRHFEENHRGSPPVFSCAICTFSTHEFSYLQIHLLSHKDTFSSCSICNDNVQRTWSEFSAHLTMHHCQNGKYSCETCQEFTTGDVRLFFEHVYIHNLGLEVGSDTDILLHTKDSNKCGVKTTHPFQCQYCGYEASQKLLITKHIKAAHVGQNGNQKMKTVHPITIKPNDPIPKIRQRLTRSAVREMCWLSQDCLSLSGREFLDKYCHLSDPQTTLEETQQFLMRSVAGETGEKKWTKALKTVLSNVPQDKNLNPKSENGIVCNSGFPDGTKDLTVLTVKNKITVAQNGAAYAKRLKMTASTDKETLSSESAAGDVHCVFAQKGCQSDLNDHTHCPQTQMKLNNNVSVPPPIEPVEHVQMQENRENQELKTDGEIKEHSKKFEEPKIVNSHEDRINTSSELKLTNESENQTSISKARPKNRSRNRGWKRKKRSKIMDKRLSGLGLKLVLKKNPVKDKQWVSQSSPSPSAGGLLGDHYGLPNPHTTLEETAQFLQSVLSMETQQKKWTKASKTEQHNPSEAMTPTSQSKSEEELPSNCTVKPMVSENIDGNNPVVFKDLPLTCQESCDDMKELQHFIEAEVDCSASVGKPSHFNSRAASVSGEETCPHNMQRHTSESGKDRHVSDSKPNAAADGTTRQRSDANSFPVSQPVISLQGNEDSSLVVSAVHEQSVDGMKEREVFADSHPDSDREEPEPPPARMHHWQPVPRSTERTLKLIAIRPTQLIKRPVGDQPVVVLNHPDVDIPEVARIMEVVNRYRGEVQKVMLSRKTLNALSAMNGEVSRTDEPTDTQTKSPEQKPCRSSLQERFMLKLKLRRLSRKKYEVVGGASPSRDPAMKFRCWFCGRVFTSQETWMIHQQRHLMEWKRPARENT